MLVCPCVFHQPSATEAPQKSHASLSLFHRPFGISAPRSGGSSEKHASLPHSQQPRAAEDRAGSLENLKSILLFPYSISPAQRKLPINACFSVPLPSAIQPCAAKALQTRMLLCPCLFQLLLRSGGSSDKHASLPNVQQPSATEAPYET